LVFWGEKRTSEVHQMGREGQGGGSSRAILISVWEVYAYVA